jgi:protein CpxP
MNRKYFNLSIISVLLISNLLLIYNLVQKPNKKNENNPRNIVIQTLEFDDRQIAQYDVLVDAHKKEIREQNDKIDELKNTLYEILPNDTIDKPKVDSLTSKIGIIQRDIEDIHFNHFMDIKQLCKPSQYASFKKLSSDLQKIFSGKRNHEKQPK